MTTISLQIDWKHPRGNLQPWFNGFRKVSLSWIRVTSWHTPPRDVSQPTPAENFSAQNTHQLPFLAEDN